MSLKTMRTDPAGGLLHPRAVISALIARGKDEIDDDEITPVQEEAIRDFIAKQESVDLGMVSVGE